MLLHTCTTPRSSLHHFNTNCGSKISRMNKSKRFGKEANLDELGRQPAAQTAILDPRHVTGVALTWALLTLPNNRLLVPFIFSTYLFLVIHLFHRIISSRFESHFFPAFFFLESMEKVVSLSKTTSFDYNRRKIFYYIKLLSDVPENKITLINNCQNTVNFITGRKCLCLFHLLGIIW